MGLKTREGLYVFLRDSSSVTYIDITSNVSNRLSVHDVTVLLAKQRSCWHKT